MTTQLYLAFLSTAIGANLMAIGIVRFIDWFYSPRGTVITFTIPDKLPVDLYNARVEEIAACVKHLKRS